MRIHNLHVKREHPILLVSPASRKLAWKLYWAQNCEVGEACRVFRTWNFGREFGGGGPETLEKQGRNIRVHNSLEELAEQIAINSPNILGPPTPRVSLWKNFGSTVWNLRSWCVEEFLWNFWWPISLEIEGRKATENFAKILEGGNSALVIGF